MKSCFNFGSKIILIEVGIEFKKSLLHFSYDSVDQIVLQDLSHAISGIKVHVEKTLTKGEST